MKLQPLQLSLTTILSLSALTTHAAVVNTGDQLTISTGISVFSSSGSPSITSGSYFAFDAGGNSSISSAEKISLSQGSSGIVIGQTTSPGASHDLPPTAGDTNELTAPWSFLGSTGSDYLSVAITGDTTSGLDLSGWSLVWNGNPDPILVGSGAWQPNCVNLGCSGTFSDGLAHFTWSGVYGDAYSLDYSATVPDGDPGFGRVPYYLHLEGVVNQAVVPIPAAVWLFASGLICLFGISKRNLKN